MSCCCFVKGKMSTMEHGLHSGDVGEACYRVDVRLNTPNQCSYYANTSANISASYLFPAGMLRSCPVL